MRIVYFIILFLFVCNYAKNQGLTNSLNEIADMNNVLGAKNLLPNNAKSQTVNGVTFTVNSDASITANGTATTTFDFAVLKALYTPLHLYNGVRYIISGCPQSPVNYNLQMYYLINGTWSGNHVDAGDGTTFTAYSDREYGCNIHVDSGAVFNNVIFYPMLRLASIQDDTYVPYSMTNREMTPYVQAISNPNLLDNPWFTVNQRGKSTYNTTGVYTVDRWRFDHFNGDSPTTKSITVSDNGITCKHDSTGAECIQQLIENTIFKRFKQGDKYTLSFEVSGNGVVTGQIWDGSNWHNIFSNATTLASASHQIVTTTFDMWDTSNTTEFKVVITFKNSPNVTFHAIKLEKGTVSTLAMDTAPNYQQELAKCQRYYEENKWYSWCVQASIDGIISFMTSYPFLVEKRVDSITTNILKQNIGNGQLADITSSTTIPSNEVTISQPIAYNRRMENIRITHNSIIKGHTYVFSIGDNCIAFSADL